MTFIVNTPVIRTESKQWTVPAEAVVDFEHTISVDGSVRLMIELVDTGKGSIEFQKEIRQDGVEVQWAGRPYTMLSFTSGGSADRPSVTLSCISQAQAELDGGGMDPGLSSQTNVPAWLDTTLAQLRDKRLIRVLDTNLGDKQIEAESDTDTQDKETTWDVIHETAKRCGAWAWVSDNAFYFGKPAWLVDRGSQNEWRFVWDHWASHSEQLTAKPRYTFDLSKKLWEGREELVLQLRDPESVVNDQRLARNIRPGDRVSYKGQLAPENDKHGHVWIVTEVSLPYSNVDQVEVTCWRAENLPEIVDENGTTGSGSAGVPDGPLGANGWNGEQLVNAAEIVKAGQAENKALDAIYIAMLAAMGESTLRNIGYGDNAVNSDGTMNDSVGLFQQQARFEGGNWSRADRLTPSKSAKIFYDAMDKHNWQRNYNEGGPSEVFGGYYGPGKSANSASLAVHNIQRNSNPLHYAQMSGGTLWPDAKIVVDACIAAGESSGGGGDGKVPSGPLGARMKRSIEGMNGRYVDVDGAGGSNIYQCADVGMQYAKDLWGIGMVIADGKDYWRQSQIAPYCKAVPANQPPRYGDIASWSGSYGAYTNSGYGHIAIYISGDPGSGTCMFLTQNPGPAGMRPLSVAGIQGWMRPIR